MRILLISQTILKIFIRQTFFKIKCTNYSLFLSLLFPKKLHCTRMSAQRARMKSATGKVVDSSKDLSIRDKQGNRSGNERGNTERQIEAYYKVLHSNMVKVCERGMRICVVDVGRASANSTYVRASVNVIHTYA